MASDESKMARSTRSDVERTLAEVARQPVSEPAGDVAAPAAEVELALADLVSDDSGEIVFCNDSGFRSLAIHTESQIVGDGRAEAHLTAAGDDVSGFNYVKFDNGLTLFFEEGLQLIVLGGMPPSPA
ncbi:MAG: hypothetical protein K0R41_3269 [Geminicoccaceae bacterium]|jgi:hypothetical protein|nr:hypothetical protein [Geminicoccaceae bacterium]MCE3249444.1 hypothetical protein [Geminicoccaceae bacterium]